MLKAQSVSATKRKDTLGLTHAHCAQQDHFPTAKEHNVYATKLKDTLGLTHAHCAHQ